MIYPIDPEMPDVTHSLRKIKKKNKKIENKANKVSSTVHCTRVSPNEIITQTMRSNENANNNINNNGINAMVISEETNNNQNIQNNNISLENNDNNSDEEVEDTDSSIASDSDGCGEKDLEILFENFRNQLSKKRKIADNTYSGNAATSEPIDNADNDPYNIYVNMSTVFEQRATKSAKIALARASRANKRKK